MYLLILFDYAIGSEKVSDLYGQAKNKAEACADYCQSDNIHTFDWDYLTADATDMPHIEYDIDVTNDDLSLHIEVIADYIGMYYIIYIVVAKMRIYVCHNI